jgi:hypothetical protein
MKPTKDDTKKEKYKPRKIRPAVGDLVNSALAAPSNDTAEAVDLSEREYENYRKSVEAYARALQKESIANEAKVLQCEFFNSPKFFTTQHKMVTPKDKDAQPYSEVTTTFTVPGKCIYQNRFYEDGEIMAVSNFHPSTEEVKKAEEAHKVKAPTMANSTVFWCQRQYLLDQKIALKPLTHLVRHEVSNEQTNDVARACFLLSVEVTKFPKEWNYWWDAAEGSECVNALLGMPNGLGAIYLVRDWGDTLGITGIDFIEISKPQPGTNRQVDMTISFKRATV